MDRRVPHPTPRTLLLIPWLPQLAKLDPRKVFDHHPSKLGPFEELCPAILLGRRGVGQMRRGVHGNARVVVFSALVGACLWASPIPAQTSDETRALRDLALSSKHKGPGHRDVGLALTRLAHVYQNGGRFYEAEPLYKRAVGIFENAVPANDQDMGRGYANLAYLYREQGRFADAEPLFRRALELMGRALPADHVDLAKLHNNLALVIQSDRRFAEAESLYKKALAIYEKQLPEDDLERITCLSNLALLYHEQGKLSEAETYYVRVLAAREKSLPQDDPVIARSLSNLGGVYLQQGRFLEAEARYRRALSIREKSLPEQHPDLAKSLLNMAALSTAQSSWDTAAGYARRAQNIAIARAKRAGGAFQATPVDAPVAELAGTHAFTWLVNANWQLFQATSGTRTELLDELFARFSGLTSQLPDQRSHYSAPDSQ